MFWGQIALQSEGPLAFFWCELPPYLANNSKTTPLTPMLMKCDLYTQSHCKLTQDSSSHKGTPLPICTVTENHREVQFKLFPVEPLSGWVPRPLAPLGSPCSRRVIGVLRDLTESHWKSGDKGKTSRKFLGKRTQNLPVSLTACG